MTERTLYRIAVVLWSAAVAGWSVAVWALRHTEPPTPPVATVTTPVPHSFPRCSP